MIVETLAIEYGPMMIVFLVLTVALPIIGIKIFEKIIQWRKLKKSNGNGSSNNKSAITTQDLEKLNRAIIEKVAESEVRVNKRIDKTHEWLNRIESQIDSLREKIGEIRGMLQR